METPSMTESQLKMMQVVCEDPSLSVFSQCGTAEGDTLATMVHLKQASDDADYLVSLKFLKNISADHLEKLGETKEKTGRNWRVFEITALGRAMFGITTSPIVN